MTVPIEKMSDSDLMDQWQTEVESLRAMEKTNPKWDWKPVQQHLERLHALAHEFRAKKAQGRAKWQP